MTGHSHAELLAGGAVRCRRIARHRGIVPPCLEAPALRPLVVGGDDGGWRRGGDCNREDRYPERAVGICGRHAARALVPRRPSAHSSDDAHPMGLFPAQPQGSGLRRWPFDLKCLVGTSLDLARRTWRRSWDWAWPANVPDSISPRRAPASHRSASSLGDSEGEHSRARGQRAPTREAAQHAQRALPRSIRNGRAGGDSGSGSLYRVRVSRRHAEASGGGPHGEPASGGARDRPPDARRSTTGEDVDRAAAVLIPGWRLVSTETRP